MLHMCECVVVVVFDQANRGGPTHSSKKLTDSPTMSTKERTHTRGGSTHNVAHRTDTRMQNLLCLLGASVHGCKGRARAHIRLDFVIWPFFYIYFTFYYLHFAQKCLLHGHKFFFTHTCNMRNTRKKLHVGAALLNKNAA